MGQQWPLDQALCPGWSLYSEDHWPELKTSDSSPTERSLHSTVEHSVAISTSFVSSEGRPTALGLQLHHQSCHQLTGTGRLQKPQILAKGPVDSFYRLAYRAQTLGVGMTSIFCSLC